MCALFQIFWHLAISLKIGHIANASKALWRQFRIDINKKQTPDYTFSKQEIWLGTNVHFPWNQFSLAVSKQDIQEF